MYRVLAKLRNLIVGSENRGLSELMKYLIDDNYVQPLKKALRTDLPEDIREIYEDKLEVAEAASARSEKMWQGMTMGTIYNKITKNPSDAEEIVSYLVEKLYKADALKKFIMNNNDALDPNVTAKKMLTTWKTAFQRAIGLRGKDAIQWLTRSRHQELSIQDEEGKSLIENLPQEDQELNRREFQVLLKRFYKYLQKGVKSKDFKNIDGDRVKVPIDGVMAEALITELMDLSGSGSNKLKYTSDIFPLVEDILLDRYDVEVKASQIRPFWNKIKDKLQIFFEEELGRALPIKVSSLEDLGLKIGAELLSHKMARYVLGFDFIVNKRVQDSLFDYSGLSSRR